jgi:hypothetical protein
MAPTESSDGPYALAAFREIDYEAGGPHPPVFVRHYALHEECGVEKVLGARASVSTDTCRNIANAVRRDKPA